MNATFKHFKSLVFGSNRYFVMKMHKRSQKLMLGQKCLCSSSKEILKIVVSCFQIVQLHSMYEFIQIIQPGSQQLLRRIQIEVFALNTCKFLVNQRNFTQNWWSAKMKHGIRRMDRRACSLQKLGKTWIYLTLDVCLERIFDSRPFMYNEIFLKKTLIEVGSSNLYASFGTFCVRIGHLFEAQRVFEKCMRTVKSLFLKENDADFEFFRKFKSHCVQIIDQFECKRC